MNEYVTSIGKEKVRVTLNGSNQALVGKKSVDYKIHFYSENKILLEIGGKIFNIYYIEDIKSGNIQIEMNGKYHSASVRTALSEKVNEFLKTSGRSNTESIIKAPMPGLILRLNKKSGDEVIKNESVAVLEAMKMENDLKAAKSGKVAEVFVEQGDSVEKNARIMKIV